MIGVLHILSQVLAVLAFAFFLPGAIGLATGETAAAQAFFGSGGFLLFVAGAVYFALRDRGRRLDRVGGFILIVLVWTAPPVLAAIPLMQIAGVPFLTALFEATSGYTTTGASALPSIETLGFAGIFFRAELQWIGGLMSLLTIVAILAPAGLGGFLETNMALIANPEDRLGRIGGAVRSILIAYGGVTFACVLFLLASGIRPFDAVCLALATVSTGGFMPVDGDLSHYANPFADAVIAFFMLAGATSIVWQRMIFQGRWRLLALHRESYVVIFAAFAVGAAYVAALAWREGGSRPFAELGDGLFAGVSLVTTTGFQAHGGVFAALPLAVVLLIVFVGGGAISTAGGVKFYRIGGLLFQSLRELRRLIHPHGVHMGSRAGPVSDLDVAKGLWATIAVALVTVMASTMLAALVLPDFNAAIAAAVSAFSNVGPLYSGGFGEARGWPSFAEFDGFAKLVMVVTMILGRIEVLAVIGAANLAWWRS